jgi:thiol-disulfide isomerase/thioredoxin
MTPSLLRATAAHALLAASLAAQQLDAPKPFPLMVGDPAPKLEVSRWLKGQPVAAFEGGNVYVVEFWATWCVPCREQFPHLSKLQAQHGDKVRVIGVSVWEPRPDEVESFVKEQGERMAYRVAADDVPPAPEGTDNLSRWGTEHGKMSLAWMKASGWTNEGIPTAFVIDGRGRVAWIGDPLDLDAPLAKVVDGSWPLDAEARAYRTRIENAVRAEPIRARLSAARRAHDATAAIACFDELLALDPQQFARFAGEKFRALYVDLAQPEQASAWAREAMQGVAKDDAASLAQIARTIAFQEDGVPPAALDLAREAVVRANELTSGERAEILDSLARVHFLRGEFGPAVDVEAKAVAAAHDDEERSEYQQRLAEYTSRRDG